MSWETETTEHPCFCGNGKLLVTSSSDEWGRSQHTEVLKCDECATKYVYATVRSHPDRPMHWIPKEEFHALQARREVARREQEKATALARSRLGDRLIQALASVRSRKAIWERLRQHSVNSRELGSFAAFNRAVRDGGRDEALKQVIDGENVEAVERLIGER